MKRKLFGIILALTLAFTCFAVAACGNDGGKETPPGNPVTVELGYAEDTGVLSWNAVEGATKYIVRISNINDTAKSAETAETTLQLYLREGTSRIALIAEDAQGRELGNGSKIVELATDFGAPEMVSGLAYDKEAGALGWTAAEGAVKYLVSISSINNEQFAAVTNAETTSASYTVALEKGIYDAFVIAVNEHGAKSHASSYRYASYVDPAYGTEISEGVYKLFDFEDENVLDLSRYASDYKAWSQENKKPEWAIVNKHEKLEDYIEADTVDFTSKALKVRAAYNEEGDEATRTSAVTFTLPEPLENWGRIYYDMFRTTNPPAGVLLTDVTGKRVLKNVEFSHAATLGKWGTVSFTRSEVLESEPEFGALAEISFVLVNGKGGVAYFDNVRFDTVDLGYFGESLYRRSTDTFTFDAVVGAQKYDMFVDGAETPIELTEPEYRFETALTTGNHSIKVIAYNGDCSREHTYEFAVGDKIKFNVEKESTGEFVLADFDTVEYREYMSRDGAQANYGDPQSEYSISGGSIHVISRRNWGNSYIKYTLPAPISKADISGICVNYKSSNDLMVYLIDENGSRAYMYTAPNSAKDYTTVTKMLSAFEGTLDGEQIVAIAFSSRFSHPATDTEPAVSVDIDVNEISYLSADYVGTFDTTSSYKRSSDLFTFGGAANATSYDLYVDNATDPITDVEENKYDFSENPLAAGDHSIRVVARKGSKSREYTYNFTIGEKIKFDVETATDSNEYILADFNTIEYREYVKTSTRTDLGRYYNYTISDGKLNISHNEDWGNGNLVYTFPTEIQGAYIIKFNGVITSHPYFIGIIYKNNWTYTDDKGNEQSTNTESIYNSSALTSATDLTYSVPMDKRDNPIVGIRINATYASDADGVAKTITLDSITYEKYVAVTGFNTKVADTENEYLLADFNANGYNDYLAVAGKNVSYGETKYSVKDGMLVIDPLKESGFNQTVKYTFPQPIDKSEVYAIKFRLTTTAPLAMWAFDENGDKIAASTGLCDITSEMTTVSWRGFTTLAGNKISAIAFTLSDWTKPATVNVDEITYEKYVAVTNFNSVVEGTSDRLLADFNVNGYNDYLTKAGNKVANGTTKYSVKDGKLVIDPLTESGFNQTVKYTFPQAISKANMLSIKVKFSTTNSIRIYAFDELGNKTGTDSVGDWLGGTPNMEDSIYEGFSNLAGDKIVAIAFTLNNWKKQAVVNIDEITYEYVDTITNFNSHVEGTENEYLLADFSVSGYKKYLSSGGNGTYALVDNKCVVSNCNWGSHYVEYTLPEVLNTADIDKIKFAFETPGVGADGKSVHGTAYIVLTDDSGTELSVYTDSNAGTGYEVTLSELLVSKGVKVDLTTYTKLKAIRISSSNAGTPVTYTKLSYTKKTA